MHKEVSSKIVFADAVPAELEALAELNAQAQLTDALNAFNFDDWPERGGHSAFYRLRVQMSMDNPQCRIIKATDSTTGETMGFVALTVSRKGAEAKPIGDIVPPPLLNMQFIGKIYNLLTEFKKYFEDKEHCCKPHYFFRKLALTFTVISSLSVHPKNQKRGVGSALVEECIRIADEANLPSYLNSFAVAHDLYLRLGFEDLESFEIDLNEIGKKYRGYGIFRQVDRFLCGKHAD